MMNDLIASGFVVDAIVVLMAIEALALYLYNRRTSQGLRPGEVITMLLAGLCLLLALRAALTGSSWVWVAGFLAASLLAHIADIRRRWRA
jgi:hypothetical protein